MDNRVIERIAHNLNTELVRRLLIKYFVDKGFTESFDMTIYPPLLKDMIEEIPELNGKIEIEPFAEAIDPTTGHARLGWNLFALGNSRMYLGETEHSNLSDLDRNDFAIQEGSDLTVKYPTTPRKVIQFVTRMLNKSRDGYVRTVSQDERSMISGAASGTTNSAMWSKNKPARVEGR